MQNSCVRKQGNAMVIEHPVMLHLLTQLRNADTRPGEFRRIMSELSRLMAFEITRNLKTIMVDVQTPLEKAKLPIIDEPVVIVSIMRAGNGMLDGMMQMLPFANVGHIGLYRDKFIKSTVEYYFKLPKDIEGKRIILLDPLLATGGTAVAAINRLKKYNVGPIDFVCLLASPKGLAEIAEESPEIPVYCVAIDRELNEKGYILPGLGDAGDRLFGTI